MIKRIKAKITFNVTENHPDAEYIKDINETLDFEDVYTIDTEFFGGGSGDNESILNYIKNDLRLVAGGGYDTEHIYNVNFDIR